MIEKRMNYMSMCYIMGIILMHEKLNMADIGILNDEVIFLPKDRSL